MQALETKSAMDRYRGLASVLAGCFARAADFLWGCRHRRTTMPITLPSCAGVPGHPAEKPDTYVVCLDCGRHLAYDWAGSHHGPAATPLHLQAAALESQQRRQRPVATATRDHSIHPGQPSNHRNENTA